ncbi:tRNA (5-methylaminomethyl-2-thiouridine)(34)-methyltransferase MnmD [Mucilaginibacter sp. RS28]|uniref:tRNA (5-methylaminomethyl-2-thiouridine)(34)-methyltransferase MnmD n=1 Tax=Mucilaginibacter straminoryzae TaxID=2932774 RepID=A0A9X1X4A3_9SPHI|nr:tRNA (5-methylaminomethyl-2-thiouridine)(34)-methyltransferase MnmD [Mucilaginibacter straminoryzae]MCJ8210095.1 tRNA (5-methylaminomethyl-2-thiouridine)(34)-methyltransferase MnmD [Mucilaginibacter straminoryzae]
MEVQQPELTIVTTADGSKTIFNPQVGEHYHSKHGALQESKHVFLDAGLKYFLQDKTVPEVSILEVGFGTGLNFLLTADYCTANNLQLNYTGIEAYPLLAEMIAGTGYDAYVSAETWQAFNQSYRQALQGTTQLYPNVELNIDTRLLTDFETSRKFDVVYFDAFAAIHQPEMWNEEAISHTVKFMKPGGVFVTYAITGNLKRTLKALDFKVEKVPGAPGKREMLRAIKR